jgi:hypothetical protein
MENQPYFHTAKAMQDIRIFIEAALAKIGGVFPYTACQSKTVAQPASWNEERSDRGRVGGEEGACSCPVPVISWCFQSHASVAVTGKKYVSERTLVEGQRHEPTTIGAAEARRPGGSRMAREIAVLCFYITSTIANYPVMSMLLARSVGTG